MTRDEVFRASGPASATSIDVKLGATKDGTITAAEATLRYSCGPYHGMWAELGAMTAFACYHLENVKSVGNEVLVNRPKTAAYRAPSAPMAAFAVESAIDELAAKVGINPAAFRIKNAAAEGSKASYGPVYGPIGIGPTLDAAQKHPHMKAPLGENQGRGLACGFWFNFGGQTCTDLNIGVDGTVTLAVGTIDVGGARASLSLVAAEELGVPYEQVKTVVADTATLGHNDMTDGSRGTFSSSVATISAVRNAITVMKGRAAMMWDIPVEDVVWEEGHAQGQGQEARQPSGTLGEGHRRGCAEDRRTDRRPQRTGCRWRRCVVRDPYLRCRNRPGNRLHQGGALYGGAGCGKSRASDLCGKASTKGGAAQGIGWALNEEYVYGDDGCLQNPSFLDYRIPGLLRSADDRHTDLGNPQTPIHPYGVRGVGETSIVPPLAAIANAVSHAAGVRMTHIPMSPPRVLEALEGKGGLMVEVDALGLHRRRHRRHADRRHQGKRHPGIVPQAGRTIPGSRAFGRKRHRRINRRRDLSRHLVEGTAEGR